jgi:hypothetical protein
MSIQYFHRPRKCGPTMRRLNLLFRIARQPLPNSGLTKNRSAKNRRLIDIVRAAVFLVAFGEAAQKLPA